MKKSLIVVALLTLGILSKTYAQEGAKVGFRCCWVVSASFSYSSLQGDYTNEITDVEYRPGFQAGVGYEFQLPKGFSVQPELFVANQGGVLEIKEEYTNPTNGETYYETLKQVTSLTSINLPISVKYELFKRFHIEAGGQLGYLVHGRQKIEFSSTDNTTPDESTAFNPLEGGSFTFGGVEVPYEKAVNNLEFSINAGLSYYITRSLFVRAKYNFGLTDVNASETLSLGTASSKIRNSVFSLGVGYRFGAGH